MHSMNRKKRPFVTPVITLIFARIQGILTMTKAKILFVCLGNICRSPLAEAIFKDKIRNRALDAYFDAASCGTSNYHIGDPPDSRTIANALKNGVAISHLGRQLCTNALEEYDYILAMGKSNYQNILKLANAQ